jgi:hypothetical protein
MDECKPLVLGGAGRRGAGRRRLRPLHGGGGLLVPRARRRAVRGRDTHSSTFRLDVSTLYTSTFRLDVGALCGIRWWFQCVSMTKLAPVELKSGRVQSPVQRPASSTCKTSTRCGTRARRQCARALPTLPLPRKPPRGTARGQGRGRGRRQGRDATCNKTRQFD